MFASKGFGVVTEVLLERVKDCVMQFRVPSSPWWFAQGNKAKIQFALLWNLCFYIKIDHLFEIVHFWVGLVSVIVQIKGDRVPLKLALTHGLDFQQITDHEAG